MQEFPANSQKAKATAAPREKLAPVTSAEAFRRKRGLGRQFKETFFAGTGRDALGYMIEGIVVPAIRDTLHDALRGGLERLMYGERRGVRTYGSNVPWAQNNPAGHVNYQSQYRSPNSQQGSPQGVVSRRSRARNSFDELVIPSRQEAEEVLERMYDILSQFGSISVAELYELTGIQSQHTDMKWGWRNLRGAKAVRLRNGGYLLDLPEPEAFG